MAKHLLSLLIFFVLFTCRAATLQAEELAKEATDFTKKIQQQMISGLDFNDRADFEDAQRGFIAPLPNKGKVLCQDGQEAWNLAPYDFLMDQQAQPTVNPSLWRQTQLVMCSGLFKVSDRIYQVRNLDISNLTIIEGDTGLIIVDPLVSKENAAAALKLYYANRPFKPVKYVIYSHSHVDHYGGVEGVINVNDVKAGKVKILAPSGFLKAAVAENVFAGTAMARRASYMYGVLLPPSPKGHVGAGLGLKNSTGTRSLVPPTDTIEHDGETKILDGLTFVFLLAPNTEAPAEMHWYIKELKALTAAENCVHTLHNLYTLRGAKTRDPMLWAQALDATVERFGQDVEVLYGMHHWPMWGRERVCKFLNLTSDIYRYIHDQTLHLANKGLTMTEIAEELKLPPALNSSFALRGYYGSLSHNIKAVYNLYLGWFDGNPAHLHVLPPVASAKKYIEYMGGAVKILEQAKKDYANGEYRWVAMVCDHLVFADPTNIAARNLEADALEQLGYQAESGPWRNFYLTGARELRQVVSTKPEQKRAPGQSQEQLQLPLNLYWTYLGIRLDGQKASHKQFQMYVVVKDTSEIWHLELRNSVLRAKVAQASQIDGKILQLQANKNEVIALFEKTLSVGEAQKLGLLQGDVTALQDLLTIIDTFVPNFAIVEP